MNRGNEFNLIDLIAALGASAAVEDLGCECSSNKKNKCSTVRPPKLTDFVDRVIAQDTATIIFWKDGTKTSVKCGNGDTYDYEKGLAMAIAEYAFGNSYYREIKKLMAKYPHATSEPKKKKTAAKKAPFKKAFTTKKTATTKKDIVDKVKTEE